MLQKKNSFGFNHADQQDDLYTSMTTSEIKEAFDSRGVELKEHINSVIDTLESTTEGDSGADNIGALDESGNPSTVQAVLNKNNLKGHKEAAELDHPDSSVTTRKLAPGSVTREKVATGAIGTNELDPAILGQPKNDLEIQAKFQQHDELLAENTQILGNNMTSPDGTKWKLTVDNYGNLSVIKREV